MSPRWDGAPTYAEIIQAFFDRHENEWWTVASISERLGSIDMTKAQIRSACQRLEDQGRLITNRREPWRKLAPITTGLCYRTKRGFLPRSRFAMHPDALPSAIFIGEEVIIGPFCIHCGNPSYVHGPAGECLNYRIHPLLPMGDLPRART